MRRHWTRARRGGRAMRIRSSRVQVSGSFLAIVVAVVLLGGTPAAVIALVTIVAGTIRGGRDARRFLLPNLANYATFPVASGLVFLAITEHGDLERTSTQFGLLVFALFGFALLMNFLMVALYTRHMEGKPIRETARRALAPLLISDMVAA